MSDRRLLPALVVTTAIFVISCVAGVAVMVARPSAGPQVVALFKDFVESGPGLDPVALFIKIFLNNLVTNILIFLGGATFGVLSIFILTTNGLVIGVIIEMVRHKQGMLMLAAAILPHGIFEIPAFLVSGALGLLLAGSLWRELNGAGDAAADAAYLCRTFLRTVLPLLVLAAAVEAFITPYLIRLVA